MKHLIPVMLFCIICCAGCSFNKNVDGNIKTTEEVNPTDERNPVSIPTHRVRLDEDVFLRYAIETILPHPSKHFRSPIIGTFVAEVIVDEKGNVANISVLQSPDDIFNDETVEALKKWKFRPYKTDDGTISFMESTITLAVPIFKSRTHEYFFRPFAIETTMPTYPDESKENKISGIVVTEVTTNQNGNVIQLNVLQSPDEYIKEATIEALKQWEFKPPSKKEDGREYFWGECKITFLFRLDNGNAEVILAPLSDVDGIGVI